MSVAASDVVIEGTNIVDPRRSSYPVTVSERMGEVTIRQWCVKPRDEVEARTVVALLEDKFGEIEVVAGQEGVVAAVMHPEGTRLSPHAVLCYIRLKLAPPTSNGAVAGSGPPRLIQQLRPAPPDAHGRPARNSRPGPEQQPDVSGAGPESEKAAAAPLPHGPPVDEIRLPERRRAEAPERSVPVVAAAHRPDPAPGPAPRPEPNTIGKKVRITPAQERRVTDAALSLNRYPALRDEVRRHKVRDSEIIRALIEWFSDQSAETQAALIRDNRQRERAERYGIGWPRPPRSGH